MEMEHRAPIHADLVDLLDWLLNKFDKEEGVLPRRLCNGAIDLLQAVTLALKGRRQEENLYVADEQLIQVRILLRMACQQGYLEDRQLLHVLELTDSIGRQVGGWLRSIEPI
jgi:hypothetical protein